MQLFLEAVPIILKLFSKARGHLLFSNYSQTNLPKPSSLGCCGPTVINHAVLVLPVTLIPYSTLTNTL